MCERCTPQLVFLGVCMVVICCLWHQLHIVTALMAKTAPAFAMGPTLSSLRSGGPLLSCNKSNLRQPEQQPFTTGLRTVLPVYLSQWLVLTVLQVMPAVLLVNVGKCSSVNAANQHLRWCYTCCFCL